MLTIRRAQLQSLTAHGMETVQAELLAWLRSRHPDPCAALGVEDTAALVRSCIDACRDAGAPGRQSIVDALESLFGNPDLPAMGRAAAMRSVQAELDGRRLCSMLETAAGLSAA